MNTYSTRSKELVLVPWLPVLMRLIMVCLLAAIPLSSNAQDQTPLNQVRQAIEEITSILDELSRTPLENRAPYRDKIMVVADRYFAWDEMAKRTLAQYWKERTPEEQAEFASLFRDLLKKTYIGKIERYGGKKVVFQGQRVQGDLALVTTTIILSSQAERVPIEYRLMKQNDQWRVYDVTIEGVSLVNNYRSQFTAILQKSSYQELVNDIRKKAQEG